jgi:hypothetical protein
MPFPLIELIRDPDLALEPLVAGDLGRTIRWVHVSELLDPSPYLEGGELILSAGVWGPRGGRVDAFVDALASAGASGLGWGLLHDDEQVPAAVVRACRRTGLTLLAVPTTTPFVAIVRRFVEHLQREREVAMQATIERNDRFLRGLAAGSGAPARILGVLHGELERDVWVGTGSGRILAAGAAEPAGALAAASALQAAAAGERSGPLALFRLAAGSGTELYLVVDGAADELDDEQRATIGQAMPFLSFALARERDAAHAERRLAAELVDVVLSGQTGFASARLHAYGLDPNGPLAGVIALVAHPGRAIATARRAFDRLGLDAVVAVHDDALVAIVELAPDGDPEAIGGPLHAALERKAAIGLGSRSDGVQGLRRSLIQAQEAATVAQRTPSLGGWARHDQLSSHALLLALQDDEIVTAFRDGLLGPLEEHDARRRGELVATLDAFLDSGGQWQATADRLHVHVNTLRHRLERVEQLTGRDLSSMADRVDFYIALRARSGGYAPPL